MISKGLNAMLALSKNLVLFLALFLSACHDNSVTSLSLAAGNQVQVNHLTQMQQPMSNPMNEPSCKLICKPTKRMNLDAELLNILSSKKTRVCLQWSKAGCRASKQDHWFELVGYATIKYQSQNLLRISLVSMKRLITQLLPPTVLRINDKCQHQSILIPVDKQPPWQIRMLTCDRKVLK